MTFSSFYPSWFLAVHIYHLLLPLPEKFHCTINNRFVVARITYKHKFTKSQPKRFICSVNQFGNESLSPKIRCCMQTVLLCSITGTKTFLTKTNVTKSQNDLLIEDYKWIHTITTTSTEHRQHYVFNVFF